MTEVTGTISGSGDRLLPGNIATRAGIAQMMFNLIRK